MDIKLEKSDEAPQQIGTERVRREGISKFLIAFGVLLPLWLYLRVSGSTLSDLNSAVVVGAISIAAYGFAGVTEVVSGKPFGTLIAPLEGNWDSLRWWQRGLLAFPLVIVALLVFTLLLFWIPI